MFGLSANRERSQVADRQIERNCQTPNLWRLFYAGDHNGLMMPRAPEALQVATAAGPAQSCRRDKLENGFRHEKTQPIAPICSERALLLRRSNTDSECGSAGKVQLGRSGKRRRSRSKRLNTTKCDHDVALSLMRIDWAVVAAVIAMDSVSPCNIVQHS